MMPSTLLIDDSELFANSIRALFQRSGILLDWAGEWTRGLSLFRIALHELVIADYNLPDSKNGLHLLSSVRALRPSSRLILISGALTPGAEKYLAGSKLVDRYLAKTPSLPEALVEEAEEAAKRAVMPSDWQSVAAAHLRKAELDVSEIDEIDRLLRQQLTGLL